MPALKDANKIQFYAIISKNNRSDFSDYSKLLAYIRHQFLPIFNSSRGYKFMIYSHSAENSSTNVIASILGMDEIKHCSILDLEIEIFKLEQKQLPVEEISNWLERSDDVMENTVQIRKERFLYIRFCSIQNGREMFEHLKAVDFKSKLSSGLKNT